MPRVIHSHVFSNGLVLVAEPMPWLESAAFTFLVPAGSAYDPCGRSGLSSFTCEMMLRGSGERDSRRFIEDLDNLGVERSESVSDAHTRFGGATLAANLPAALSVFADLIRRPHLPEQQMEAGRLVMLQELRSVEDEPSEKVMIELRRRHYPAPWGQPSQGDLKCIEETGIEDIRRYFEEHYRPNGTILGVAGRVEWERLVDTVGELVGDWTGRDCPAIVETSQPRRHTHLPFDANQTQIGIAYPSVPYRDPDYFNAWGAVGVLSGGMSSRLFTEVRERRGLCYAVYASYHTLLSQGAVFCYAGTSTERAQETLDVTLGELSAPGYGNRSRRTRSAEGPDPQCPDHATGIEFRSQRYDRPGLVSPWTRPGHGGNRTVDRRIDLRGYQRLSGGASAKRLHRRDAWPPPTGGIPWSSVASGWRTDWTSSPSATRRPIRRPWVFS